MSKTELPPKPVFNSEYKGRSDGDVVMIEVFPVQDGEALKLTFENSTSPWRQGVWLKIDGHFVVNSQRLTTVDLWQDTAPNEVLIECHAQKGFLHLYNIWDKGNRRESQSWLSGMLVEKLPTGRRYHCHDTGFDADFTKLVFRLERAQGPK